MDYKNISQEYAADTTCQNVSCFLLWQKIPAEKRCNFSWLQIRLTALCHHPSFTDDESTAKEHELTK